MPVRGASARGGTDVSSSRHSMRAASAKSFRNRGRSAMKVETIGYQAGGRAFVGALVYDEISKARRPLMLMAPNWLGVTQDAIERTKSLVGANYVGFVADMYGDGKTSDGPPEAAELANALRDNPNE